MRGFYEISWLATKWYLRESPCFGYLPVPLPLFRRPCLRSIPKPQPQKLSTMLWFDLYLLTGLVGLPPLILLDEDFHVPNFFFLLMISCTLLTILST